MSPQSELVQGQSLTTVGDDPVPGGSGEAQGGNGELADLGETLVIEDLSDNDDGLGTLLTNNNNSSISLRVFSSRIHPSFHRDSSRTSP